MSPVSLLHLILYLHPYIVIEGKPFEILKILREPSKFVKKRSSIFSEKIYFILRD
jgi:hypothetical protein